MILGKSDYIGKADYADVLNLLKTTQLSDDYREELFSLVKIAQRTEQLGQ
jgi:hypothetical protein